MESRTAPDDIVLITLERGPDDRDLEVGALVSVSVVQASNIIRDVRELITNAFGGRMRRYETLLETTMTRALTAYRARLSAEGYDGALGVRFSHPKIVDGGAEFIVYGTGFRWR